MTFTPLPSGDVITLRPFGSRQSETVALVDVYHWARRNRRAHQTLARIARKLEKRNAVAEARRAARGERRRA